MLQEKNLTRNLYQTKLPFKNKGEINTLRQTKTEGILTNRPALQGMLKKFFREKENYTGQKLESPSRKEKHWQTNN